MKCDGKNCLECELDDCIYAERIPDERQKIYQARWRAKNHEKVRAYSNEWRRAHADEINKKNRDNRLLRQVCFNCKCELKGRKTVQKYGCHYFCTNSCISEYLLQKTIEKGSIKTIIMPHIEGGG